VRDHGVAGADSLGVEEETLDKGDVVVGEFEDFPLFVGGEPEAWLLSDQTSTAGEGLEMRDWVRYLLEQ
jgi:hypothetical protein